MKFKTPVIFVLLTKDGFPCLGHLPQIKDSQLHSNICYPCLLCLKTRVHTHSSLDQSAFERSPKLVTSRTSVCITQQQCSIGGGLWNRLPRGFAESLSLETFKTCLDTFLCELN